MKRNFEQEFETDFNLTKEQLDDFVRDMKPHGFDSLKWAKSIGLANGDNLSSFGYIHGTEIPDGRGRARTIFYADGQARRNFFIGLRKRYTWATLDLESCANQAEALTPLWVVEKIMEIYEDRINHEKYLLSKNDRIFSGKSIKDWIGIIKDSFTKESKYL